MGDPVDLEAVRELLVEAEGIEATYGSNPYTDHLRKHKCRPSAVLAETIGRILGGCVRADDGKMYPAKR